MNKLNKRFNTGNMSVESMVCEVTCSAYCEYSFCTCQTTTAYAGHYNRPTSYVYEATVTDEAQEKMLINLIM